MKIYWTVKSIPELQHLSFGQAWRAYRQAYFQIFTNWRGWIAAIALFLMLAVGMQAINSFFTTFVDGKENQLKDLAELLLAIVVSWIYSQIATANVRYFWRNKGTSPLKQE